ncbi:hypothetical protein ACP70R_029882 [Stipagrostis hirtigluma subsp. patula]
MGFKQVFYGLREVFPQVDLRILKAVASQYSSDIDAAVEFVLSDVLPAVSEPTEAHYTLQDIDYAKNDLTDSGNFGTLLKRNQSQGYGGPLCTSYKLEECSPIEDKVVINETRITPTIDYAQVGAFSTSSTSTKPLIVDYEQSTSTAFVHHCAMEKGEMTPKKGKADNKDPFNCNYDLPDFFLSSVGILPVNPSDFEVECRGQMNLKLPKAESTHDFFETKGYYNLENSFANLCPIEDGHAFMKSSGASAVHMLSQSTDNYDLQVLYEKEIPVKVSDALLHVREQKLSEAESIRYFSKSEDNFNLDTLFVEVRSNDDTNTLPSAPTVQALSASENSYDLQVLFGNEISLKLSTAQSIHDLSKSEDNFDLHVLFEKEMPMEVSEAFLHDREEKLSDAESIRHFSKSEENFNLDTLFVEVHTDEDIQTLPSATTVHALSASENSYDLQFLFQNEVPLELSTAQSIHDLSKLEDNFELHVLFENISSGGKQLNLLHTAGHTSELLKSEDDLLRKQFTRHSILQAPRFLVKDDHQQSPSKLDSERTLSDLFSSSKNVNNSVQIVGEKKISHRFDGEEQPSTDFMNPVTSTSVCNLNDDFNLSELFSYTPNVSLSDLDSKSEVIHKAEREIMRLNSLDDNPIVPVIVHDASPWNGIKLMPGADNYEEFLDINTRSDQITGINKLVSEINSGKEALCSLYDSTNIKMEEVELQEENSRKAKQEAAKAHQGFVSMVENCNQVIQNSKESNDKQAQIVREEKSLLAALAQDLQSRLTKLSTDRDEALTIVEKINFELDARLAASVEEEAAAREQIRQEEKLALLALKEKETQMERIMEVSRKLQKETEENILLRDFLLDRGCIIDVLQGEISNIHEKVVALKERAYRSKLQASLITTSSSATSCMADCKSAPPDRHWPLKNQKNSTTILPQEKMAGCHAEDGEFLDDEWEML